MLLPSGVTSGFLRARSILTLDPALSGDSIWWHEGVVREVGWSAQLGRKVPTPVPRFDLPRTIVTPGFVDGHTHFASWGANRRRVRLAGTATRAEALERIARGTPKGGWVLGQGWLSHGWDAEPDRWSLDAVVTGPAWFESGDLHAGWANSAALAAAGIDRQTPDPEGGRIVRDGNGEPSGVLLERAMELMLPHLPVPTTDELVAGIRESQTLAHEVGITGIHDVEGPEALAAFRQLELAGELKLRVLFHPPVAQLPTLIANGVRSGQGTPWLALGGVKLFLDGSLGSRTAWMLQPYEDGRDRGMPLGSEAEARRAIQDAAYAGISCVIHAIGDAAVRRALDLLDDAPRVRLPHRIEHFQCVHAYDLDRAARNHIVASMQPVHLPGDVAAAEERWGARSSGAYPLRSLIDNGTILAFGSDTPVAPLDPRQGIVAAMGRVARDGSFPGGWYPEQRIGFEEAVRGFTIGNALAAGRAERAGRLAPGYEADLVAWSLEDAGALPHDPQAFGAARVALTVVGGEVVYAGGERH
ncbi:MAG TPA: amidohydrolase [Gemmatimonadales bacterium]|nr:amidohydrolase [Gemmatimonadales bacterium]